MSSIEGRGFAITRKVRDDNMMPLKGSGNRTQAVMIPAKTMHQDDGPALTSVMPGCGVENVGTLGSGSCELEQLRRGRFQHLH